jgi:hypothetical protein
VLQEDHVRVVVCHSVDILDGSLDAARQRDEVAVRKTIARLINPLFKYSLNTEYKAYILFYPYTRYTRLRYFKLLLKL